MEMATEITLPVSLRVCLAFGQETCFISSLTPTKNLKKRMSSSLRSTTLPTESLGVGYVFRNTYNTY